jgi:hypothetical protein
MWQNTDLKNYIENSSTIKSQSLITAEWNLNIAENIDEIGNYFYRPNAQEGDDDFAYATLPTSFSKETNATLNPRYFGATDSDTVVDGGYKDDGQPNIFTSKKEKYKKLFSLEDCFNRFRPRSGINKAIYFDGKYLPRVTKDMALQPRFYFPGVDDKFKYWTSLRYEAKTIELTADITNVSIRNSNVGKVALMTADNDFEPGDFVNISDVVISKSGANDVTTGSFIVKAASSSAFKVYLDPEISSISIPSGHGSALVNRQYEQPRGISYYEFGYNYIDDASPFIVYKNQIPTNRIILKMQTKVGDVNLGPYQTVDGSIDDPFYGDSNKAVPKIWKIEYLDNSNNWNLLKDFDENTTINSDGYIELAYGLTNDMSSYPEHIVFAGEYSSLAPVPIEAPLGYAYLVTSTSGPGEYWISNGGTSSTKSDNYYTPLVPTYGWYVNSETAPKNKGFLKDLSISALKSFTDNSSTVYRELQYIKGLRVSVDEMTITDATFDLIELSPRLAVDLSDRTTNFSITKHLSDLGSSGMPVGQLLSSTGNIDMLDYDQAFNENNTDSILHSISTKNLQIKFYESIFDNSGHVYYVPIKTMYADGFPQISNTNRHVSVTLRDMLFYFESIIANQILIPECSLSMAVSSLLDSIGFSNYTFKRITDHEPQIPYFFVGPDTTVAKVLQDLAMSTQTAMFFDEMNNLVLMEKEYMLPGATDRPTDITLYGSEENNKLANIVQVKSEQDDVYNDGKITYSTKYIQRSYGSLAQANVLDSEKTWIYKPVLLWEVSPEDTTKSWNDELSKQTAYSLSAIALNSDLSDQVPTVSNGVIINNTIDLGDSIYWLSRYNGYFYANGEIIRFDAVEYNVGGTVGNVWIANVEEYQRYFAQLSFGGKLYPTGKIRIYSEPFYDSTTLKEGAVSKHGRGQFGTTITSHSAGVPTSWTDGSNQKRFMMTSKYMFNGGLLPDTYKNYAAGNLEDVITDANARNSVPPAKASGLIKNFLSSKYFSETSSTQSNSSNVPVIQSSALTLEGPSYPKEYNPQDFVNYVSKTLDNKFVHFGTRMRIIGSVDDQSVKYQTPVGTMPYYTVPDINNNAVNIGGSSGGIGIWVNPATNCGYYFEIVALTNATANAYTTSGSQISSLFFYKVESQATNKMGIPIVLWNGYAPITVDDGKFVGQDRTATQQTPTVYDISVEYENSGSGVKFYLYLNNKLVGTVVDNQPINQTSTIALFERGSSKVMFENVYAVASNYSQNNSSMTKAPIASVFSDEGVLNNNALAKYAPSSAIQKTFLQGINPQGSPDYNLYFEEFGTLMREMAYFNIRYDKAYPALSAKITPTFNNTKGYVTSGFVANAYGAEFLVFNATDSTLNLDSTSGNYLRIQGVSFTQQSQHDLTVDEFLSKKSDLSNPQYGSNNKVYNVQFGQQYADINKSRITYGKKAFTIAAPYIQTQQSAEELMAWLTNKIMQPKKAVGVEILPNSMIQLGDIVTIDYLEHGIKQLALTSDTRFVVYSIEYSNSESGPTMTLYLSEVV